MSTTPPLTISPEAREAARLEVVDMQCFLDEQPVKVPLGHFVQLAINAAVESKDSWIDKAKTTLSDQAHTIETLKVGSIALLERANKAEEQLTELLKVTEGLALMVKDANMEIASYHIDWALTNSASPDYDPSYKPTFPDICNKLSESLTALTTFKQKYNL